MPCCTQNRSSRRRWSSANLATALAFFMGTVAASVRAAFQSSAFACLSSPPDHFRILTCCLTHTLANAREEVKSRANVGERGQNVEEEESEALSDERLLEPI